MGQYLELKVKVGVSSSSPVDLNGFWLHVVVNDSKGKYKDAWIDFTKETITKGSYKLYDVKTNIQMDKAGHYYVTVEVWNKDKTTKLAESLTIGFDVVQQQPQAWTSIESIGGYLAVATMIIAGVALAVTKLRL